MPTLSTRPASDIPGPPFPGPLQSWLGIAFPIKARLAMRRRYGGAFRSNDSIAGEVFHIADRDLVEQMFKWKPLTYNVAEPREIMAPVVGDASLLLLDGNRHMRMRKLMLPPFHGKAIESYAELIEQITDREIDKWSPGETIRTRTVAQAITMEVMIRAVFGISDPDRIAELKRRLPRLSSINPVLLAMQKDFGPLSPWGRFLRNRDRVDEILYEEIGQRRDDPDRDSHTDILTLLLSARDDTGNPLTDKELRDELITILLAGHETTATSIGWAFERLLRTPAALERLTAEVKAGEPGEYLDAVIKETLRVRPVVTEVFRSPTEPTELGGYRFEAGAQLAVSISLLQCDPDLYGPDPFAFRPERFLEGAPESYTWIPFGGGVRRCIGASFALLEMKVAIARILSRTRLRAPRAKDEKANFRGVTVLPSRGGEAVVESVSGPPVAKRGDTDATAVRAVVRGEVQGVFFRDTAQRRARELGVMGWVRNEEDGSVLVHAEGAGQAVEELVAFLREGPRGARVAEVETEPAKVEGHEQFAIRGVSAGAFVVQEHAATAHHFDLRLEVGGAMRSWAVPKGPSLDPAVKRLAVEVEDHSISHNSFEGVTDGGGVIVWDQGHYEQGGRVAWPEALDRGHAVFVLHGEKLRGGFALQRTRPGEKPQWLLIKRRDEQAQPGSDVVAEQPQSVLSGSTLEQLLGGD